MEHRLIIKGRLDGYNEYIDALNSSRFKGAELKKANENIVMWYIINQLKGLHITNPVILKFDFYEINKKRDLDNVSSFARKVIQDALVQTNVLKNDGWRDVRGFVDQFYCDKDDPRIELTIVEVEQ